MKFTKFLAFLLFYAFVSYVDYIYKIYSECHKKLVQNTPNFIPMSEEEMKYLNRILEYIGDMIKFPYIMGNEMYNKYDNHVQHSQIKNIGQLKEKYQNFCLQNPDNQLDQSYFENMNEIEKLQAFNEGPCSPTVIIPGLMATRLVMEIDCEVLQEKEPYIFETCGWNTCEEPKDENMYFFDKQRWFYNQQKPDKEYTLWIGNVFGPQSFIKNGDCFGNLMSLRADYEEKDISKRFKSPQGLKISWYGNSEETKENETCGKDAVINFAEYPLSLLTSKFFGYRDIIAVMEVMGYQSGITYQAIPYDFRKAIVYNNIDSKIEKSLLSLYKFTGKKSVILSHSYGSVRTLHFLTGKSQEFKDKYILQWIANGSPFSGVNRLVKSHINSDDQFVVEMGKVMGEEMFAGINIKHQRLNAPGATSLFDLYPKDVMIRHKDEPWMQEVFARIQYEQNYLNYMIEHDSEDNLQNEQLKYQGNDLNLEDENSELFVQNMRIPLDFLPPVEEQCTHELKQNSSSLKNQSQKPQQYDEKIGGNEKKQQQVQKKQPKFRDEYYCKSGLYDQRNDKLAIIDNVHYEVDHDHIQQMLQQHTTFDNLHNVYGETQSELNFMYNLTNPGVPMINIYGGFGEVEAQYHYEENPNQHSENEKYYFPKVTKQVFGDITVSSNSALLGPLKWIWEEKQQKSQKSQKQQQQKQQSNVKPVRLVELCSSYNVVGTYDQESQNQNIFTKQQQNINNNNQQSQKSNDGLFFSESGYNGLQCRCHFSKNPHDCDHAKFLNDPFVVDFFATLLINNQDLEVQKMQQKEQNKIISESYKNEDLIQIIKDCPNLH